MKKLAILLFLVWSVSVSHTQAYADSEIQIRHNAPAESGLGAPGELLSLPVLLTGTKDFEFHLRALVVRDGVFMDVSLPMGTLSPSEQPTYTLKIPSPLKKLEYSLFLYDNAGNEIAASPPYQVARTCIPRLTDQGLSESANQSETVRRLALRSRVLERHIAAYENAALVLNEISTTLSRRGGK